MEEALAALKGSREGLTTAAASERLTRDGLNALTEQKRAPWFVRFGRHLLSPFAVLLWIGAALALTGEGFSPGEGMAMIGLALIVVVLLNASFTFWQQGRVEQAMAAFRDMISDTCHALRDGHEVELPVEELALGDIIVLRGGDRVPADARLLEAHEMKVDNASLTGESQPVRCGVDSHARQPSPQRVVWAGTLVVAGTGRAIAYATGDDTELGRVAGLTLAESPRPSPLQKELAHFTRRISAIAIILGAVFFGIGLALGNPFWTNLVFAIGIIVANVPEGLLPTVTLALSGASVRLARRGALVKNLESVETLGCTTLICTDKTGTLTLGDMRVTDIFTDGADHQPIQDTKTPGRRTWRDVHGVGMSRDVWGHLVRAATLCNNANLDARGDPGTVRAIGDPTETALLLFAEEQTATVALRSRHARLREVPFDGRTKDMVTVHSVEDQQVAYLKGAPEVVVARCSSVSGAGGPRPMDAGEIDVIQRVADTYADRGRRVLALAYRPVDGDREQTWAGGGYVFVALVAMYDPPRREVPLAIDSCRRAGIKVVVVSGDHPRTVAAIAREVGIITRPDAVTLTGTDLAALSDGALEEALAAPELVLARTSPEDKLRIVERGQALGHIVAVTGDGVNDAPALKRADIGVAMGLTGRDVAKQAADIVLMNDDFATIVTAVEEGRVIYSNIRKVIAYILTSNIPEILPFIAFVLLGIPLPLTVVLILAIDLGTDLLPALGLAAETAESDVMALPPRARGERMLSGRMLGMSYGIIGTIQAAAAFTSYFYVLHEGGWSWGEPLAYEDLLYRQAIGASFISIIVAQVADVLICRTRHESLWTKGLFSNRLVLVGVVAELVLALLVIYTPTGQAVFHTAALPGVVWLIPIPFALAILAGDELRKLLLRRGNRFVERWLVW